MNDKPSIPGAGSGPADELAKLPQRVESPTVAPSAAPPGALGADLLNSTLPAVTDAPAELSAFLPIEAPMKVPAPIPAEPPTDPVPKTGAFAEAMPTTSGIGVLLVNLGTPDAAEPRAVRRYLKEFLTDPRVIENNSLLWKVVLHGIILPLRSRRKAGDYRKIWNNDRDESPLKTITRSQAEKLSGILEPLGKHVIVDWAMRYQQPSIASRLEALVGRGCDRILVMPLYPQYAAPTTATVCDEVFRFLMGLRRQPALRIMPAYYDDPYYIEVLASSLKAELKGLPFEPEVIVASYHGMPQDYVNKGDPYESQCVRTTQLLREQLKLDEAKLMMTYQSRFGAQPLAQAVHDPDGEGAGQEGRQEPGRDHARFLRRLPRNAGRDRGRERQGVQALWRSELRRHTLPQRQRGRHADDLATRHARAQGLGVIAGLARQPFIPA